MIHHLRYTGVIIALLLLSLILSETSAQVEELRLVSVDATSFPNVAITVLTFDAQSAPVDPARIEVSENGAPVSELTFGNVPVGVDITWVIDANTGINEIDDDSETTRLEKAKESIRRYVTTYLNPDGLDRVSIVVPADDGQSGQFLIQDTGSAAEILQAINTYETPFPDPTPLNAMITMALQEARVRGEDGRFQALLLFTDGRRLNEQLSYPLLVAQANDAQTPIFGAILGQSADAGEIDNLTRLSDPTHAFHVHMPQPEATDGVYQLWQQQGNPAQIQYRSQQRQSGRNQVTLNLGSSIVSTSFEIALAAPEVELLTGDEPIRRVGTAADTPLPLLQPIVQPLIINIAWPDELPRQISEVKLISAGQQLPVSDEWQMDEQGQITLGWDISNQDEGKLDLVVQVLDELGYQGVSAPAEVEIMVDRPLPPTIAPTTEPDNVVQDIPQEPALSWQSIAGLAAVALLIAVALLWRRPKDTGNLDDSASAEDDVIDLASASAGPAMVALLEQPSGSTVGEQTLDGDNILVGSAVQDVQIALDDPSIGRLHARIRLDDGRYWLFDEGSLEGTFLNFERLGLAPRELTDGDTVQFGKLTFVFRLRTREA